MYPILAVCSICDLFNIHNNTGNRGGYSMFTGEETEVDRDDKDRYRVNKRQSCD